jgi:hypothetical protein
MNALWGAPSYSVFVLVQQPIAGWVTNKPHLFWGAAVHLLGHCWSSTVAARSWSSTLAARARSLATSDPRLRNRAGASPGIALDAVALMNGRPTLAKGIRAAPLVARPREHGAGGEGAYEGNLMRGQLRCDLLN